MPMLQNFQAVTSVHSGQVLRYCIDEGAQPLWGRSTPRPGDIPPCSRCGAPRRFEFQILPQMLSFLGIDDTQQDSVDWCACCYPAAPIHAGAGCGCVEKHTSGAALRVDVIEAVALCAG